MCVDVLYSRGVIYDMAGEERYNQFIGGLPLLQHTKGFPLELGQRLVCVHSTGCVLHEMALEKAQRSGFFTREKEESQRNPQKKLRLNMKSRRKSQKRFWLWSKLYLKFFCNG